MHRDRAGPQRPARRGLHGGLTLALSWALVVLGAAQLALAPARGSGPAVYVVGAVFVAVGAGRLWLERRRR